MSPFLAQSGHALVLCTCPLLIQSDIRLGTALALLLAAVTLGLVVLILIAADATEREHRKW